MRARVLCLAFALTLCLLGGAGTVSAACPANFCVEAEKECKAGCSCAIFTCDPVECWSDCSCPIVCWDQ